MLNKKIPLVETGFLLPTQLTDKIRNRIYDKLAMHSTPTMEGLDKLSNGVWWTNGGVNLHTDMSLTDLTTGIILINDCNASLIVIDGVKRIFKLPAGSIYRIRPNIKHGVAASNNNLFCFLSWDHNYSDSKPFKQIALEMCFELTKTFG